jgi:ribosomal protein S18 acetylase RimI-like enzyme
MTDGQQLPTLKIDKIEKSDVQAVLQMMSRLAEQHHETSKATSADLLKHAFWPDIISHIWVARIGQETVGFIEQNFGVNYPESLCHAHVNLIYVRDGYRKKHVGLGLMQTAMQAAIEKGCNRFYIEAFNENENANSFYDAIGMTIRSKSPQSINKYEANLETMNHIIATKRDKSMSSSQKGTNDKNIPTP